MKVVTVVGTRPEIIRLSRVIARFDEIFEHILVHTGQNWDPTLNDVFFSEMQIRRPDYLLQIDTSSLGAVMADTIRKTEEILLSEKPDAFLVLGDTNSALSILIAKRLRIPTYHMEAGNRCFDENVPEETNRRLVDHVADFNCVYTEHARRNLIAEGLHPRRIMKTGSPMKEVLAHYTEQIRRSGVLPALQIEPKRYFLVSAHREETVDNSHRLDALLTALNALASQWDWPVIVSTHPRTRKRIQESSTVATDTRIRFLDPFGFFDYNNLQMNAACVLSDSGTISEESSLLGFPAITLRASMERPEALETASIAMIDVGDSSLMSVVDAAMQKESLPQPPDDYLIENTSERITNFILSTAPVHSFWSGLR